MEPNSNNNTRHTPARRGRGGKARGRKNYASEGDVLSEMPTPASFPTTPLKSNNVSPAPGSQPPNAKSTTRKNTRKPRPSNVSTSPGSAQPSQRTPPPSASATVSSAAFASSSSFHSPAPATLPRPAFSKFTRSQAFASADGQTFVRTRSESVVVQSTKEPSPPASDCESPTPAQAALSVQDEQRDSTLEKLFQAEKERMRRANSAQTNADLGGPFSAPPGSRYPPHSGLDDNPIPLKLPSRPAQRGVSGNSCATEPIHEHFQPTRPHVQQQNSHPGQNHTAQQHQHLSTPPQFDSKSEQIKRLLGIGGTPPSKLPTAPLQAHPTTMATTPGGPQATGGFSEGSINGGGADRKNHVENALRQALNLPWSIGSGFDGTNSPRSQSGPYPGHG